MGGITNIVDTKSIIIIVLVIALLTVTDGCGYFGSHTGTKTTKVVKVDTVAKEVTKVARNDSASLSPSSEQDVIIVDGKTTAVDDSRDLTQQEKDSGAEKKTINRYEETSVLPNGVVRSTILSSGDIYSTEYSLTTTDTTITKETETKTVIAASGLYGYAGTALKVTGGMKSIEIGLQYIHRNRWFVGAGINYLTDPFIRTATPIGRVGVTVKVGIKL